jgi:hypothetical protein
VPQRLTAADHSILHEQQKLKLPHTHTLSNAAGDREGLWTTVDRGTWL